MRGGEARLVGRERELTSLESALDEAATGGADGRARRGARHRQEPARARDPAARRDGRLRERRGRARARTHRPSRTTSSRSWRRSFSTVGTASRRPMPSAAPACRPAMTRRSARWAAVLDDVLGEAPTDDPRARRAVARRPPADPRSRDRRPAARGVRTAADAGRPRRPPLGGSGQPGRRRGAARHPPRAARRAARDVSVQLVARLGGPQRYEQLNLRALRPEDARRMAAELAHGHRRCPPSSPSASSSGPPATRSSSRSSCVASEQPMAAIRIGSRRRSTRCSSPGSTPCRRRRGGRSSLPRSWGWSSRKRSSPRSASSPPTRPQDAICAPPARGAHRRLRVPERTLAFRHPLIHEVAYRSLLVSTRRSLHGRIGRWLEEHGGEEQTAELARHYRDSDDPAKARHYLPLAGERARR